VTAKRKQIVVWAVVDREGFIQETYYRKVGAIAGKWHAEETGCDGPCRIVRCVGSLPEHKKPHAARKENR
jgi:hypothetical protein